MNDSNIEQLRFIKDYLGDILLMKHKEANIQTLRCIVGGYLDRAEQKESEMERSYGQ